MAPPAPPPPRSAAQPAAGRGAGLAPAAPCVCVCLRMSPPAELVDELPFLALILVVVVLLPCTVLFRQVCVGRIGVAAARESMFVKIAPDLPGDAALEESLRHFATWMASSMSSPFDSASRYPCSVPILSMRW